MIHWGIVGFGKIAHKFVNSIEYTTNGKVVAIASRSVQEGDEYLVKHPEVKLFRSYEEMFQDADIDAVYIATVHKMHYEQICMAMRFGKHVLCEKPAVLHSKELEHIKELSNQHHVFFMEALKTKINKGYIHLTKDISLIGELSEIRAAFCNDARMLKGTSSFLYDKEQGGAINDISSYLIGFALGLFDTDIDAIHSVLNNVDGINEHFTATLTIGSCMITLEGAIDEFKERNAIIMGSNGRIDIPMFNRLTEYTITTTDATITKQFPFIGDDMTMEIEEAGKCIKNDMIESPYHTIDDSIQIMKITEAIRGY